MQWNMDFQLSALVILFVVGYLQISGRYVPIRRSRIFITIIIVEILTVFCNLISMSVLYYKGAGVYNQIQPVIDIYYALQYSVAIWIMAYLIAWTGREIKKDWIGFIFFIIPVLVYAEEIIRNFGVHHLYHYDSRFGFLETSSINILNGVAIYCMLYGVVYCVMHARFNSFGKLTTIAILGLVTGVAVFVQSAMAQVVFIDFVVAIALLILYSVAQNSSEILDHNTQVLNRNMMDELLEAEIMAERRFDLLVLALDDFKFVNKTFGVMTGDMMLIQVGHFLSTLTRKGNVFRYGSDQFVPLAVCLARRMETSWNPLLM